MPTAIRSTVCQANTMKREILKGLLGASVFSAFGIFTIMVDNRSIVGIVVGTLCLAFGLTGLVAITIGMMRGPAQKSGFRFHTRIPPDIEVRCVPPDDEEIEEQWEHYSPTQPLLSVDATKSKESSEYRWQVGVYLAEFARDPGSEQILDPAIYEALKNTAKVLDVRREDAEVWVVSGEPSGRELVVNAGAALAKCIPSIVPLIAKEQAGA